MVSKKKLNLLLTNDDGIDSLGIKILQEKLQDIANIYVLAPASNRSAVSSHIIMDSPLTFVKMGENSFSCSGYPADCVISAMRSSIFDNVKFDAVISGINKGSNMGTDCIYSGTVAAARQAVLYGIPGIALSLKSPKGEYYHDGYEYEALADFARDNIHSLISLYRPDCVISINALSQKSYKGAKFTSLCIRDYKDKIELAKISEDYFESCFRSGTLNTTGKEENEYEAVCHGYIAITRFHAEPVDFVDYKSQNLSFVF
ncbi:5'/3'-nucleotidase SurE [Treponema pectinovorum]|uniref:5'/3'-nucleotidase SurE n=1 Tax=Treponema pectinovorum TaxID=164 RepID=UPI0011CC3304|nr:5'/3'-nucleotidase SurE [Treponema pectinovorum]